MVDAAPRHVGDVEQAVDAAKINEGAVIGDVLDQAVDDLIFCQTRDDFGPLLGAAFFQNRTARDHDVAAAAIHLQNLERLLLMHQRPDIAHGADIDLRTRQERDGAVEIDGETALDLVEDDARDLLALLVQLFKPRPAFLALGLVSAEHRFSERILDALQVDFDGVADLEFAGLSADAEFLDGDAAFHFEADVDDRHVLLDADDLALDDGPFEQVVLRQALGQHRGEIVFARAIIF